MEEKVCIIGLGYVGLPLYLEFKKSGVNTIGYDINEQRVRDLLSGHDNTGELEREDFHFVNSLTSDLNEIKSSDVYIVTVPTPIDEYNSPDISILKNCCYDIGKILTNGNLVVFESTVYPGCTNEECIPILEKTSGLQVNKNFHVGYSPERVSPGIGAKKVWEISKIISGSDSSALNRVNNLYSTIIKAQLFEAKNIKTAEAAKVVENTQRDLNIALVNELSMIFDKIGINTYDVLEAAKTKWNFHSYQPGLVGGHCIGVDPYYLLAKSIKSGFYPELIHASRRVNENMIDFVVNKIIAKLIENKKISKDPKILVLGATFKENCPDIRNSKAILVYKKLKEIFKKTKVFDPMLNFVEFKKETGIKLEKSLGGKFDYIAVLVPHSSIVDLDFESLLQDEKSLVFDLKSVLGSKPYIHSI